jgi:hypothetical protein
MAMMAAIAIGLSACGPSPTPSPAPSVAAVASQNPAASPSVPASNTPSSEPAPSASPSPAPTTAPSAIATVAHLHWTKSVTNLPTGVTQTGVSALAMRPGNPPTYLAISFDHRVWLSSNGTHWRRGGDLPGPDGGNVWWIRNLFVRGSTFVAFGISAILEDDGTSGPYSGIVAGYVWTSDDGERWSRTSLDGFSATTAILDDGRFVVAGGLTGQSASTLATSATGRTWKRIETAGDPWQSDQPSYDQPSARSLAGSRASGYLVLVPRSRVAPSECPMELNGPTPITWRSTDLQHWQPAATLVSGCALPTVMISGPGGDLAMRATFRQDSDRVDLIAWTSADGLTWRQVAEPPGPLRWLGALAIAPDGTFLAIGDGIWESVDGEHWALSAPVRGFGVEVFAGDLAIACDDHTTTCVSLRLR